MFKEVGLGRQRGRRMSLQGCEIATASRVTACAGPQLESGAHQCGVVG